MTRRHPVYRLSCVLLLSGALLLGGLLAGSVAQVSTAIRPDATLGTTTTSQGTVHTITGGARPGNGPNLFHSFERFNVGTGATVDLRGATGITNILSRVTGGQRSEIDGTLRSTIDGTTRSTANLYLLNPSGVLFGPNARLDVGGAFHVSTADYLRLADGATFAAHLGEKSTLTVAPPAAFGFWGPTPAPITVQDSTLQVRSGNTLSMVGGDIMISGGRLSAPSGRVQIASVASAGHVTFTPPDQSPLLNVDAFERFGEITFSEGALIRASGNGGGTVVIRGGRLIMNSAQVAAETTGSVPGASIGIDIQIAKDIVLTAASAIGTLTLGANPNAGAAGDVVVKAHTVTLTDGGQIRNDTFGPGRGGTVHVQAADAVVVTGWNQDNSFSSAITASSQRAGKGDAGAVLIEAHNVTVAEGAEISTLTVGSGQGGKLTIKATGSVILAGTSRDGRFSSIIGANTQGTGQDAGDAGAITVEAQNITLTGGAQITSSTEGPGRGSTIRVSATDSITLDGHNRDVRVASSIVANTRSRRADAGEAGTIFVEAKHVTISNGARITSNSLGPGQGGTVWVTAADAVTLTGTSSDGRQPSAIDTAARGAGENAGDAGAVMVEATRLTLTEEAQINSGTSGPGSGGSVTVRARHIELNEGGTISTRSSGTGNAGNIVLQADERFRSRHGAVTTEAERADGGNITLMAGSLVDLRDSQITATVKGGEGQGGNILMDPQFIVLQRSQVRADAFGGPGGNVRLVADVFLADPASQVSASSALNLPGTVDIQAAVTDLSELVAPLTPDFARATELLRDRCAARLHEGTVSSFVVRGPASVPATYYDGLLPSRLYEPQSALPAGQPPQPTTGSSQGQHRLTLAGRDQASGRSVLPLPSLALTLPCAR